MEYIIHIKPKFNCLVKSQNFSTQLVQDKIHTFLLNTDEKFLTLSFYPLENGDNLAFSTAIILDKAKLNKDTHNLDLIKFPKNNLLLIVRPFCVHYPKPFNIQTKIVNFANIQHTLYWSKNDFFTIRIENSDMTFIDIDFLKRIVDLNTKTIDNKLIIYSKTKDETYVICVVEYSQKSYKILNLEEVNLLESEKNKITTYKNAYDVNHHGVVKEYNLENNFSLKSDLVYNENQPFYIHQRELIPYAFFNAVKMKNFDLAREYLSNELKKKLKDTHLVKFFGSFLFAHQSLCNDANINEIALIYKENDILYAKIFDISINEENKIINITEL